MKWERIGQVSLGKRVRCNTYVLRYRDPTTGRRKFGATGITNKDQARRLAIQLDSDLAARRLDPTARHRGMTWMAFVKEYIDYKTSRNSPATVETDGYCLGQFTRIVSPKLLADVDARMIDQFVQVRAKKVRPETINKAVRVVRAALRWAARRGYISAVPDFSGVFIREVQKLPVVVKPAAFDNLLRAVCVAPGLHRSPGWWTTFLRLARFSGARRGELLALPRADVDLPGATMTIRISKGRREREIPLDAPTVEALASWLAESGPGADDLVFPGPDVASIRWFASDWDRLVAAAGLNGSRFRLKDLRSTCASELAASGVPSIVAQGWLGHSTITTTSKFYTNPAAGLVAAARTRAAGGPEGKAAASGADATGPASAGPEGKGE